MTFDVEYDILTRLADSTLVIPPWQNLPDLSGKDRALRAIFPRSQWDTSLVKRKTFIASVEQAVKKAVELKSNSRRKSGAQRREIKRTQLKLENQELGSQTELNLKGELQMERVAARQKQRDLKVGSYSEPKVKREDQGHESLDTFQAVPKPEPKIKLEDLDHDHKGPDILEALIKALEGMA